MVVIELENVWRIAVSQNLTIAFLIGKKNFKNLYNLIFTGFFMRDG